MSLKYPGHGNKIAPCYRDRLKLLTCPHTFLWAYQGAELTRNSVSAQRIVQGEYSKAVGDYISRTGTCREKSVFLHGLCLSHTEFKFIQDLCFYDDDRLKVVSLAVERSNE